MLIIGEITATTFLDFGKLFKYQFVMKNEALQIYHSSKFTLKNRTTKLVYNCSV